MKKIFLSFWLILCAYAVHSQDVIDYVNPFIGTTNFGATNPGAVVPQGMVSVVPFNVTGSAINKYDKDARWWSAPYSYDNKYFTGYSHVNLSGVGCPDLGVILLMPTCEKPTADLKEYGSVMSEQKALPGYYSCRLDKYNITTEVTATKRTGLSRFTFQKGKANILIDLGNGLTNETGAYIQVVNNKEIVGWRMTGTFCYQGNSERPVYFVARFSKPAKELSVWKKMPAMQAEKAWSATDNSFKFYKNYKSPIAGDSIGACFSFETEDNEQIMVQIGVSYVSIDNARENLNAEFTNFDFNKTVENAQKEWRQALSKIQVEGGTLDQKTKFYTSLYHINIHPNIINDVNGQYPMMESHKTGQLPNGQNRYTVFSLWDTYRNFHQFMSLVYPDLQLDMIRSMIDMYKESGWLPKWELNSTETFTMSGDPAVIVIADTYLRGLRDFDIKTAYEAMIKSATTAQKDNKIRNNHDFYIDNGYMPLLSKYDNSVSEALEYYIADWNLGQLAKEIGRMEDFTKFNKRSMQYVKYFDSKGYKILRPKLANGKFLDAFDPMQGKNFEPVAGFHEGTAWNYAFCVQHDIQSYMQLMGGKGQFYKVLNRVFADSLFDMTNEPDMHYPYLFNYIKGKEWRTQQELDFLMDRYFKNSPDGLPGNDDCGTMSAWLAFSMMGFYPICPGDMNFAISKPVFDKVTIHLNPKYYSGKTFTIIKNSKGKASKINKMRLNNKLYKKYFINNKYVTNGGVMEIVCDL